MHAYIIFCIFCFFISLFDSGIQIARVSISMKGAYPISAVKWLQTQKIEGRVFADYRWGGFLINTLQNQKVFIDGRMPSWRGHMYPGESESAMDDYFTILAGQYHRYFNDYSVNYVLWPRGEYAYRMGFEPQLLQDNQLSLFLSQLRQDGWHLVYQDDVALIYRR